MGFDAARAKLASLSKEVALAPDCGVPHLAEGVVYSTRALLIGGYLSAYLISERTLCPIDADLLENVRTALTREIGRVKILGESEVPALLAYCAALEQIGEQSGRRATRAKPARDAGFPEPTSFWACASRPLPRCRAGDFTTAEHGTAIFPTMRSSTVAPTPCISRSSGSPVGCGGSSLRRCGRRSLGSSSSSFALMIQRATSQ